MRSRQDCLMRCQRSDKEHLTLSSRTLGRRQGNREGRAHPAMVRNAFSLYQIGLSLAGGTAADPQPCCLTWLSRAFRARSRRSQAWSPDRSSDTYSSLGDRPTRWRIVARAVTNSSSAVWKSCSSRDFSSHRSGAVAEDAVPILSLLRSAESVNLFDAAM